MKTPETNDDSQTLALRALAWCVDDARRAGRLLELTGLTTNDLRARAAQPAVLAAILGFVEAHEPDLIACAEALDVKPERLIAARRALDQ
jgi:hypothetical protein